MVLDQELDELCVFRLEAVRAAETPGLEPAQLRMIAPAALGDVVEDRRYVPQPVALEAGDEAAAQRTFVCQLEHGEAAPAAHAAEPGLVNRRSVESRVL